MVNSTRELGHIYENGGQSYENGGQSCENRGRSCENGGVLHEVTVFWYEDEGDIYENQGQMVISYRRFRIVAISGTVC
ncbi:MAG: hypothetical protein CL920_25555 [Deltaproteobacteria bacterium]|nr:hypothetical protein [Deltaproteobacteria bacterium]MBU52074.1 hypothetical protein [Deltaproteobacteria bacterium]